MKQSYTIPRDPETEDNRNRLISRNLKDVRDLSDIQDLRDVRESRSYRSMNDTMENSLVLDGHLKEDSWIDLRTTKRQKIKESTLDRIKMTPKQNYERRKENEGEKGNTEGSDYLTPRDFIESPDLGFNSSAFLESEDELASGDELIQSSVGFKKEKKPVSGKKTTKSKKSRLSIENDNESASEDSHLENDFDRFSEEDVKYNRKYWKNCDKCGQTLTSKDDLQGQLGGFLKCITCPCVIHVACLAQRKVNPSLFQCHACTGISNDIKESNDMSFQSGAATPLNIPFTKISSKPIVSETETQDNGVEKLISAAALTNDLSNEPLSSNSDQQDPLTEANQAIAPVKRVRIPCDLCTKPLDMSVFRCYRCYLLVHMSCLVKDYKLRYADEKDRSHGHVIGSEAFFWKSWKCGTCSILDSTIEKIVKFDFRIKKEEPNGLKGEADLKGSATAVNDAYLVKFQDYSHLHLEWVPRKWLESIREYQTKYRNFRRKIGLETQFYEDEEELAHMCVVEKIVDVDFTPSFCKVIEKMKRRPLQIVTGLMQEQELHKKVAMVMVKWKYLAYDSVTWEDFPVNAQDLYSSHEDSIALLAQRQGRSALQVSQLLVERLNFEVKQYMKRIHLSLVDDVSSVKAKRKFAEYFVQPEYIRNGQLKDYQREGVNWLTYKWSMRIPCVLADEMGLGKTIQIASFLAILLHDFKAWPFLIVVPTSLMAQWKNELSKWVPAMVTVVYNGTKKVRELIRMHEILPDDVFAQSKGALRCHTVLTNYETIMSESNWLSQIPFRAIVCDEGHRLKNETAKTFAALAKLNVDHRIILTGTPLQNNMKELFSIMKFLDPVKFNDPKRMELQYSNLRNQDVLALHKALQPHFLRRTKQVLRMLPPKVEVLVPVSLTAVQAQVYKAVLQRNLVLLRQISAVQAQNAPLSSNKSSSLQNIMMELRKVCGHPYLTGPELEPTNLGKREAHQALVDASSKLQLLQQMLPKLKEAGHRVLLFSQFKLTLNIIEDFLLGENHIYCRLDGDVPTSDRQHLIDAFNAPDSDIFVFLLTTRTGGLGLNLATADTIVIYDADWNPHQDLQAIARAHRIGQENPVIIYKLYTKNCVEEKIIHIGKKKLVLDHVIVENMGSESLGHEELSSILRYGAGELFDESGQGEVSRIKYDEAAVTKLLDRECLISEQTTEQADNLDAGGATDKHGNSAARKNHAKPSFSFAREWTLETKEEPPGQVLEEETFAKDQGGSDENLGENAMEEEAGELQDITFWDRILQHQKTVDAQTQEEESANGFNLRKRKDRVNYSDSGTKTPRKNADENDDEYDPSDNEVELDDESENDESCPNESVNYGKLEGSYGRMEGNHGKMEGNHSKSDGNHGKSDGNYGRMVGGGPMDKAANDVALQKFPRLPTFNPDMWLYYARPHSRLPRCFLCPDNPSFHALEICPRAFQMRFLQEKWKMLMSPTEPKDGLERVRMELLNRLMRKCSGK